MYLEVSIDHIGVTKRIHNAPQFMFSVHNPKCNPNKSVIAQKCASNRLVRLPLVGDDFRVINHTCDNFGHTSIPYVYPLLNGLSICACKLLT